MKYIVDFDTDINKKQERATAPAGVDKAKYIIEGITSTGEMVEIISPAGTRKRSGYVRKTTYSIDDKTTVKLFATFGAKNKVLKGIRYYLLLIKLFLYLFFNTKRNEKIVVYHMMKTAKITYLLKKIKKLHLILQVEEIYSDVRPYKKSLKKYEYKVIEIADSYIFPTKLLSDKINKANKPYVVVHGTYHVEKKIAEKFNDGKIHCVYAGTFDPIKGGAQMAVNVARYLDDKYHVHIIGFGKEREKEDILKLIDDVSKNSRATVTFDGLKQGKEYIEFLQSCHIGLSTQNPEKDFNNTSFPSKILSYLVNGLCVVSVKVPVLETSNVNSMIFYYNGNDGKEASETVKQIDVSKDSREFIVKLDKEFKENIKNIVMEEV